MGGLWRLRTAKACGGEGWRENDGRGGFSEETRELPTPSTHVLTNRGIRSVAVLELLSRVN